MANGGAEPGRRPAGPRWVEVSPERVEHWLADFARRHDGADLGLDDAREVVTARGGDGAAAECHLPFPPLAPDSGGPDGLPALLAAHAAADRTVAVLLVRLGGYAAGVFRGVPPALAASKTGSRLVHGRSAAGGQSQQRFARRREKQAREALEAAADCAAAVFGPYAGALDALVTGGDKRSVAAVAADPRLRGYAGLTAARFLTVPDPRLAVLRATPPQWRAVRIRLTGG